MRTTSTGLILLCSVAALSSGCKEYFTIDEACHPDGKFRGQGIVSPAEAQAINRMNCYRRLTSLERYGVEKSLYTAAEGQVGYMLANPEVFGTQGSLAYIDQRTANPGYTGASVYERMDAAEYTLFGTQGNFIYEVVAILADSAGSTNPAYVEANFGNEASLPPSEVIDEIMRYHWLQETVLTPSTYDVAYAERPLDAAWWEAAAAAGRWEELSADDEYSIPVSGKAVYYVVVAEGKPTEHSTEPLVYPKDDQTSGVGLSSPTPIYKESYDTGELEEFTFSYPLLFTYVSPTSGTAATTTGSVGTATSNPYGLRIENASITGPQGPLDVVVINPEGLDEAEEEWVGLELGFGYLSSHIMATEPFEPGTTYTAYVDATTSEGPISHNWTFTTDTAAPTTTARRAAAPGAPVSPGFGGFQVRVSTPATR
jgi:hypothetical protein